jgi:hypothetical protein
MTGDRLVQALAALVMVVAVIAAGSTLPVLNEKSDHYSLRYTDVTIEGAPPFIALGTAIGALRGIIVDYLWIKVNLARERGLFFEVMHDADLITKLQPRFAAVWAFHGHNMAYNISVATHTQEERWEWVNAGIRLVRNQGLRYNPNDLQLHRELAFWFAHKLEGVADDAHPYYKTEFCREWHFLLGEPPEDYEDRIAWIGGIAGAPETLDEAERRTPGVRALVDQLRETLSRYRRTGRFDLDQRFLEDYGWWKAATEQSYVAQLLGLEDEMRRNRPMFVAFDALAGDPDLQPQWETLLAHVRKRVLKDEYNMEPERMHRYTKEFGPFDWRHGQSHSFYWSRRGTELGEPRVFTEDNVYRVINNDRVQIQALQDLARWGRISFDPFSNELLPARFPEPRWIDTIEEKFHGLYAKHYGTRGAGGETFIGFLQNFISSAIREAYRSGEMARAQRLMDMMDGLFGSGQSGAIGRNPKWALPLDVFVREETFDQYQYQPHLAPSEVAASLRFGLRMGVGRNQPEIFWHTIQFANEVTRYFQENEYNDHWNKFGRGRIRELISQLHDSLEIAFLQFIADPTLPLQERLTVWRQIDQFEPELRRQLRLRTYDRLLPAVERQFEQHALSHRFELAQMFPAPRGIEQFRIRQAQEQARREAQLEEQRRRDAIERR